VLPTLRQRPCSSAARPSVDRSGPTPSHRPIGRSPAGLERAARLSFALALAASLAASAAPRITLSIEQAKEVAEVKGGARSVRLVPAKEASPGEVVEYTLHYKNEGDEPATSANIDDPIPKGSSYLAGTAAGEGTEITFSTDGGKTFAPAVKLTYEVRGAGGQVERRTATPGDYTHVRWTVKSIPPGQGGKVTFRVRVN
jgi:uncharacterized repeat protein (TIGR01451 family)